MNRAILMYLTVFTCAVHAQPTSADSSLPEVLAGPFEWQEEAQMLGSSSGNQIDAGTLENPNHVWFRTGNKNAAIYNLRTLGPSIVSKINSKHYAIIGHIKYSDVASGTFLELENWFAPEQPGGPETFYFSRTLGDAGPMAKLEGSDDGRDFALPFDATGAKTPLDRLVLKLHIMGPGEIELSNVRLVQYPDKTAATSSSASSQAPPLAPVANNAETATLYAGYDAAGKPVWNLDKTDYRSLADLQAALQSTPRTRLDIRPDQRVSKGDFAALLQACRQGGIQSFSLNGGPATSIADSFDATPPQSLANFATGNPETMPDKPAEIILDVSQGAAGPQVKMRGATFTPATLGEAVKKELAADPRTAFIIRGEDSVPHATIAYVLDALRHAHATNIFFANVDSAGSSPAPSPGAVGSIDRYSFALGIVAAFGTILAACGLFVLARRFRGLRHARELRRIASLDG